MAPQWFCRSDLKCSHTHLASILAIIGFSIVFNCQQPAQAQTFDSRSRESDGALNITAPTDQPIEFDPTELGLDPDGDNIYHFTTIIIGPGVTVRLTARKINGPVFWLASGTVQIDGTIDLNGDDGNPANHTTLVPAARIAAVPGAGGFPGGIGGTHVAPAQPGSGPGGGGVRGNVGSGRSGGGAGHATPGDCTFCEGTAGAAYGNNFLVPLLGSSGGGGGQGSSPSPSLGAGGGAGGGALLIASS